MINTMLILFIAAQRGPSTFSTNEPKLLLYPKPVCCCETSAKFTFVNRDAAQYVINQTSKKPTTDHNIDAPADTDGNANIPAPTAPPATNSTPCQSNFFSARVSPVNIRWFKPAKRAQTFATWNHTFFVMAQLC